MNFVQKNRWGKPVLVLGLLTIRADRWPWQKGYNWRGAIGSTAPLNPANKHGISARFGGGWGFKLGIDVSEASVMFNLGWGMVVFSYGKHQWASWGSMGSGNARP